MNRWHAWFSHILTALVGLSGIFYFWMKYAIKTNDPFSVVNHPLEPFMLDLHVFSAPLFVFIFGLMFESHVAKKLKSSSRANRRTGWAAMATFVVMVISGYALQVTAIPMLIRAAWILHIASSIIFLISYVAHQVITFRLWTQQWASSAG